jgi:hypothetical protein
MLGGAIMRKTAMAFLFCLIGPIANAQEIIDLQKPLKCSRAESVMNFFKDNYQEVPLWVGKTTAGTHITLLVNKETRSWTMIEYDAVLACVLGAGDTSSRPEV